jgi:hypothetical protein
MPSQLSAGTKLGRYEIRSLIGAGGMGEVYLAHDVMLNRDVAVKVLPAAYSADSDRLRRFQQEAQAAGALNQPNIQRCTMLGLMKALLISCLSYSKAKPYARFFLPDRFLNAGPLTMPPCSLKVWPLLTSEESSIVISSQRTSLSLKTSA